MDIIANITNCTKIDERLEERINIWISIKRNRMILGIIADGTRSNVSPTKADAPAELSLMTCIRFLLVTASPCRRLTNRQNRTMITGVDFRVLTEVQLNGWVPLNGRWMTCFPSQQCTAVVCRCGSVSHWTKTFPLSANCRIARLVACRSCGRYPTIYRRRFVDSKYAIRRSAATSYSSATCSARQRQATR